MIAKLGLRTILIGGAVATAMVFGGVELLGSARAVRAMVETQALEQQELLARGLAATIEQFLTMHLRTIQSLADELTGVAALDARTIAPVLRRARAHHDGFWGIGVTDGAGRIITSDPPTAADGRPTAGIDLSDREWFQRMRRSPSASVDRDVVVARSRPTLTVTVNAPVVGAGALRAAVSGGLDLTAVDAIVTKIRIGTTGYAQVATAGGTAIAHPRRDWVAGRRDMSKLPVWSHVRAADAGRIPDYVGALGDRRLAGFATVGGVGWKVWVSQARDEIEADVARADRRVLAWAVVALLGIAAVATTVAFAVITPIRRLQVRAAALARGQFAPAAPEQGPAEVAALARAFNEMANALERREAALKRSEERYRQLFARNFVGIFRTRPDGTLVECNDAFARILGHRNAAEVRDRNINIREYYITPVERDAIVDRLATGAEVTDVEVSVRRHDGSLGEVSVSARRIMEDDGPIHEGTVVDLTDRKRAERALQEREAQLRNLGNNLADGVIYQVVRRPDGSNYFPYMSSGLEERFGLPPGEAVRNPEAIYRLLVPEDLVRLRAAADESIRTGVPFDVDCRVRRPHGDVACLHVRGNPRRLDDGSTVWDAIALDVTRQRQIEEDRRRLEAQAIEAQRHEALGVVAGGIAHDFNNLLAVILARAELIRDGQAPANPAAAAPIIAAAQRGSTLVQQLLAYAGRAMGIAVRVRLLEVVADVIPRFSRSVRERPVVRVERSDGAENATVHADPAQLRQALLALLMNACEATPAMPASIVVRVGLRTLDRAFLADAPYGAELPPGVFAFLEVEDNGTGMDEATKAKMFDPFFSTKFFGRGLGLTAVLGILRTHAGTVEVDTRPGRGTRVTLLFPAA